VGVVGGGGGGGGATGVTLFDADDVSDDTPYGVLATTVKV
jgi:hypothetical protein